MSTENNTTPNTEEQEPQGVMVGNKEIFSTDMTMRLVKYEIGAYAGINMPEDTSFLIEFPKDQAILLGATGDQGVGKTSFMHCAMELLGGDIAKNGINELSKRKNASITLMDTRNGMQYIAKFNKKTFSLSQVQEVGGSKQVLDVKSPKEFLRKLIGPLGVNPMELAEMKPAAQIKWVRDLFHLKEEELAEEERIVKGVKKATADRKNVARDLLRVRNGLVAAGYAKYNATTKVLSPTEEYEKQKKYYTKDIAARQKEVTDKFNEANQFRNERDAEKTTNIALRESKANVEEEIADLEMRLEALRQRDASLKDQIFDSDQKINKNAFVDEAFEEAQIALSKMNEYVQGRSNLDKVDEAFLEYDQYEEQWKLRQSELDEYNQLHKKFVQLFTPDIEGIEICVPSEVDIVAEREMFLAQNEGATDDEVAKYIDSLSSETREGIFYNGHSMDQLSELEVWEVAMMFWSLNGVTVAFIENVTSLGSKAKERIEWLAQKGCTIFFSAMKRSEKELKAEFYNSIPE